MKIIGIIPARFASTRFPGKPLVKIGEKTMIQRVYEKVEAANLIYKTIVATDDERIFKHVQSFGGNVLMTAPTHESGTERCAEIIDILKNNPGENFDVAINIQGDEPFIQSQLIDDLAGFLIKNQQFEIATAAKKITTSEVLFNPNVVKVVLSESGKALYFSRQTIPFIRGLEQENWLANQDFYKHIGIYAFRTATLLNIVTNAASPLEKAESLEQLRWLYHDYTIGVLKTEFETIGIDTPEDLLSVDLKLDSSENVRC
jgi:3-deoxy-manno-octulosonate cytidylyltransferase (CMP-KDO synthetase)